MQIELRLTGTSPLLMHSDAGVNAEHPLNKAKALLTKKTASKRTAEENREIRRLEWLLGIYTDGERVVYPTANVLRCIKEAGKITKQGAQVSRGLSLAEIEVALNFRATTVSSVEDMFDDPDFVDERSVGIGQKRVMRVRPRFSPWGLTVTGELFDDVMDVADLERIAELAGKAIGLGDYRGGGFGRFEAVVV